MSAETNALGMVSAGGAFTLGIRAFWEKNQGIWECGVTPFPTHQMFATWPLQIQTERQCAFRTVLISTLSAAPVPRQVCAYAKPGGHRVLRTAVAPRGRGALVPSGTPHRPAEPCRRAEGS